MEYSHASLKTPMTSEETTQITWNPDSWQTLPALQQPTYPDAEALCSAAGAESPASPRHQLGDRRTQTPTGRRGGRPAVCSAGGRLRRAFCRLLAATHHQQAEGAASDEPRAGAGLRKAGCPHWALCGPVRQASLLRYRGTQRRETALLPRRHHQSAGVHSRSADPGSANSFCAAMNEPP